MKRKISYDEYLNRVYGCFLGKAISGNIGAPHEGVKMPMNLPFLPSMIDCERPNDDLDLQVLWLSVAEKYGLDFTSRDLLQSFSENCDYSPGEYAIMRKNYERGIYPPDSGAFCNDVYTEGMGCPIRSEIWACLAVGDPAMATELAHRDGILDHIGESVWMEEFLARLESEAFFTQDIRELIRIALTDVDPDSRMYDLIEDVMFWCENCQTPEEVRSKILFSYGHPDCTNMYQNIGITIMALLFGEGDILKTSMIALNAGFDTDCTCATAGAIIGILKGADELIKAYHVSEATYKLGVRCERRSNTIFDLATDIAHLGVAFSLDHRLNKTEITDAPCVNYDFVPKNKLQMDIEYIGLPAVELGDFCEVTLTFRNLLNRKRKINLRFLAEHGLMLTYDAEYLSIPAFSDRKVQMRVTLPSDSEYVYDTNKITVTAFENGESIFEDSFGVAGATPWKFSGPFWRTEPIVTTEKIMEHITEEFPYKALFTGDKDGRNLTDEKRFFHLNYMPDNQTEYLPKNEWFTPVSDIFGTVTKPGLYMPYEETVVSTYEDTFYLSDFCGMQGPITGYLSRIITLDEDENIFIIIGHSAPFVLYLNGEEIARRDECENWTNENVHLMNIPMKKGDNELVFKMTRVNQDDKFNVTFARGRCCDRQIVTWKSKNPQRW